MIVHTKNTIKVRLDTHLVEFITFPSPVVNVLDGRLGASYVNELSKSYDLTINPTTQLADTNIEGDWVLFMPSPFAPTSFTDVTGETISFDDFSLLLTTK